MFVTEIYKDKINTPWKNDETFLCVFDEMDNIIFYYDFCNGLRIMQNEKNMIIYINNKDLVPGKWVFFGTKAEFINKNIVKERIKVVGFSTNGLKNNLEIIEPWRNCYNEETVSEIEQKKRISLCNSCPFFDKENISCTVNNRVVLELTKYKYEYCPKELWGNKEEVMKKLAENATIISPEINQKEQEKFEEELEEYLKGL